MNHFSQALLRWYKRYGRDLPWRHTRDSYAILVSEIMLQQTQVDRVIQYYQTWMSRFPDWKTLSRATTPEILEAWAGLGYNRRALSLRAIAQYIVNHGQPQNETEWKILKGIGDYTAAAVSLFALNQRVLPIDTNIRRVLGRVFLGIPYPQLRHDKRIQRRLDDILPKHGRYADIAQALFDLATITCKKIPDCASCPLQKDCKAASKFLSNRVRIPKQMIKKPIERRHRNKPYPDRIYRGRILKLVREHKHISISSIGRHIDPDFDKDLDTIWVQDIIDRMIKDKLLHKTKQSLHLSHC